MTSFQVPVLGFLFVSFRSTLIHSHSCFSGDSLVLSLSGLSASSSLSFVRVLFASSYLAFCFFRSLLLGFASQWLFQCFGSSFRLYRFPHSLLPDFSCIPSWFRYLAFCLFPFILPGFAPTAVPPVIPSVHFLASVSLSGFSACLQLSFVRFSPLLITQHSALSFPFFLTSPMQRFSSVLIFLIRTACFHAFLQILVLSFLRFLSPIIVSSHRTTSMSQLFPYGSQLISLGLRFRFRVVGFGISSCFRCFPAVYLGVSQAASLY